jgi:hypothetical protein
MDHLEQLHTELEAALEKVRVFRQEQHELLAEHLDEDS